MSVIRSKPFIHYDPRYEDGSNDPRGEDGDLTMNTTGYLIFETCKTCNLGKVHTRCPNQHRERFAWIGHDKPVPDGKLVDLAKEMHEVHGFAGRIGFHYYNEPLCSETRLWRLMDAIDAAVHGARYTLWTNGTRWPKSPQNLKRFEEVHLTNYGLPEFPVDLEAWTDTLPHLQVHQWQLDNRITAVVPETRQPCRRMFTEFVVDYYGNVHLCCYDWRGLGSPGNVQDMELSELVRRWKAIREAISGRTMTADAPHVCLECGMRSTGITRFVPEVAEEAERYVRAMM